MVAVVGIVMRVTAMRGPGRDELRDEGELGGSRCQSKEVTRVFVHFQFISITLQVVGPRFFTQKGDMLAGPASAYAAHVKALHQAFISPSSPLAQARGSVDPDMLKNK